MFAVVPLSSQLIWLLGPFKTAGKKLDTTKTIAILMVLVSLPKWTTRPENSTWTVQDFSSFWKKRKQHVPWLFYIMHNRSSFIDSQPKICCFFNLINFKAAHCYKGRQSAGVVFELSSLKKGHLAIVAVTLMAEPGDSTLHGFRPDGRRTIRTKAVEYSSRHSFLFFGMNK
jgi:hypothetical protein